LLVWATGVIDVIAAASRRKEMTYMKTFTIDIDNAISVFATPEEAAAAMITPFESFASQKELAALTAKWPAERLVEIWNGLPGVEPVKSFKSAKTATAKIWDRIQSLGDTKPESESAKPQAKRKAKGGAQAAMGAPAKGKSTKKATSAKKAPKAKKGAKQDEAAAGPREGSKTAQVVEMLQRKNGATLEEIMEKMGWQKHTVRGFMAGAMKKAGYEVESFKSDKGERTYRINS
jgi:hypothetical protein